MTIDLTEAEQKAARRVALESLRRYRGYVEADDVAQELLVWMYGHEEKVRGWREGSGYKALYKALSRAAHRFCEREKAAQVGYHLSDNVGYGVSLLRELLKAALNPGRTHGEQNKEALRKGVFESMPPLPVEVIDVRRGLKLISESQALVLARAVEENFDYGRMAELEATDDYAPTDKAMEMRVYHALKKLSEVLSQPREQHNPYQGIPRHSNANKLRWQNGDTN